METTEKHFTQKELEEMFILYKNALYGFILSRTRNKHDAEDLFSQTFIKFFQYAKKNIIKKETIKSFLFKIATNTMIDFFRKQRLRKFISLDNMVTKDEKTTYYHFFTDKKNPPVTSTLDNKYLIEEINETVSKLPEKQKEAFYLRFIENFSFNEIAEIQTTSVGTALSRVRYATNKIKAHLEAKELLKND